MRSSSTPSRENIGAPYVHPELLPRGNDELHQLGGACDRLVRRIRQFEPDLVRTRLQSDEDHRFAARVDGRPRLAIHVVVKVSEAWRYRQGSVAVNRQDAQVFGPVLKEDAPQGQLLRN